MRRAREDLVVAIAVDVSRARHARAEMRAILLTRRDPVRVRGRSGRMGDEGLAAEPHEHRSLSGELCVGVGRSGIADDQVGDAVSVHIARRHRGSELAAEPGEPRAAPVGRGGGTLRSAPVHIHVSIGRGGGSRLRRSDDHVVATVGVAVDISRGDRGAEVNDARSVDGPVRRSARRGQSLAPVPDRDRPGAVPRVGVADDQVAHAVAVHIARGADRDARPGPRNAPRRLGREPRVRAGCGQNHRQCDRQTRSTVDLRSHGILLLVRSTNLLQQSRRASPTPTSAVRRSVASARPRAGSVARPRPFGRAHGNAGSPILLG